MCQGFGSAFRLRQTDFGGQYWTSRGFLTVVSVCRDSLYLVTQTPTVYKQTGFRTLLLLISGVSGWCRVCLRYNLILFESTSAAANSNAEGARKYWDKEKVLMHAPVLMIQVLQTTIHADLISLPAYSTGMHVDLQQQPHVPTSRGHFPKAERIYGQHQIVHSYALASDHSSLMTL